MDEQRIKQVLNTLESGQDITTGMLDVLSLVGVSFEFWLRYVKANKIKRDEINAYLCNAIKKDLLTSS